MELIIFVGYQGSGKSSFYKEHFEATHKVVSKDKMGSNKNAQQAKQITELLTAGHSVVLDNTNVSKAERAPVIAIGKKLGARIIGYWFDIPFDICLARNMEREGKAKVPPVAMYVARKRWANPTMDEGFDEIKKVEYIGDFSKLPAPAPRSKPMKLDALHGKARPAIFLDKDGVIVDDSGYPHIVPTSDLLPDAPDALRAIAKLPYPIIVVSNQAWVAKGRLTMDQATQVFADLKAKVEAIGGRIDATYFCPHPVKAKCECRKPGIGMLKQAAQEHNIDLAQSVMIGDMMTDVQCGHFAGCAKTVLVKDGKHLEPEGPQPTMICKNLKDAVDRLFP
jgi:D,D-heptose 1,7-bisphosphate phosphatase